MEKLKPCPACGAEAKLKLGVGFVQCSDLKCNIWGPSHDENGKKWNALPRRTTSKRKTK
jgi:hypothetical protein